MFAFLASLIVEQPTIILGARFGISPAEWMLFAAMYVTLGFFTWDRLFLKPTADDLLDDAFLALAVAETHGTPTRSQALALIVAKATFILLWLPYMAFFAACQTVLRTAHAFSLLRTRHLG